MILKEFFSKSVNISANQKGRDSKNQINKDDLFWYILDHDRLHKDYFFPIAKKIKKLDSCSPEKILELYMPMVKKGCKEYYSEKKLNGHLGKIFSEEVREELCHKLHNHYFDDIKKNKYNLGQ
jgi:hypothetical protein